jgi:hypothetical protein
MLIIGLGHKAQNGKDTAGEAIKTYYDNQTDLLRKHGMKGGLKVSIVKFAAALYKECMEQYGMEEKDPVLLQDVGMMRRGQDPNYWIDKAFKSIPVGTDIAVFTDVRFLNETEFIKSQGGHLINVVRMNEDGKRYIATDRPYDHPSETDLNFYNWDYQIISKSPALTGELAVTIAEFIRGLETK